MRRVDGSQQAVVRQLVALRNLAVIVYLVGAVLGLVRLLRFWAVPSSACGSSDAQVTWAWIPPGPVCRDGSLRDFDGLTPLWIVALVAAPFAIRWFSRLVDTISTWTLVDDLPSAPPPPT